MTETLGWLQPPVAPDEDTDGAAEPGPDGAREAAEILVVDDNADMRAYVTRCARAGALRTRTARNGAEALAAIAAHRPDLVVSDVMMPEVDGYELVRRLRADEQLADLPVMLLTAQASSTSELRGVNVGADDHLVKPFSADELLARVDARLAASADRRLRQSLSGLAGRLLRCRHPDEILATTHALLAERFEVVYTSLAVTDPDGHTVQLQHVPPLPGGVHQRHFRVALDTRLPACAAIRDAEPVVVRDLADVSARFPDASADFRIVGVETVVALPLPGVAGEPEGALVVAWADVRPVGDDEVVWFQRIAATVRDALGSAARWPSASTRCCREFQERLLTIDHRSPAVAVAALTSPRTPSCSSAATGTTSTPAPTARWV